jgi:hypothetical protein
MSVCIICEGYASIADYDAHEQQRKELFGKINRENFGNMQKRESNHKTDYKETSSSNAGIFFERLMQDDTSWLEEINKKL